MDISLPNLLDATVEELQTGLDSHVFTSCDLVDAYWSRIVEVNNLLGAVIELNPDAVAIAERCDHERIDPHYEELASSPIHGLPMLVNDNISTTDRMNTTAGSCVLDGTRVNESSTMEVKLRQAGAIILGKTNMSEFSGCRGYDIPEGWSGRGRQTFGAYFPKQNPRGSSSGSAVAVSIGLAWAAVGTDTDGCILMPADANNIVGLRPTVGLTSRYMVIPVSRHLDTVGTLTRTVKDAAYLLTAISGPDPRDEFTSNIPFDEKNGLPDYVGACQLSGIRGKRIGVPRHYIKDMMEQSERYQLPPGILDKVIDVLRGAGAEIVDNVDLPGPTAYFEKEGRYPLKEVGFMVDFQFRYLSNLDQNPDGIDCLDRLLHFTRATPHEGYPEMDTGAWEEALDQNFKNPTSLSEEWERHFLERFYAYNDQGLPRAFERQHLDAIVAPTPVAARLASPAGLPALTVPVGRFVEGTTEKPSPWPGLVDIAANKPFGITFVGPKFSEPTLFQIGYALEQKIQARKVIHPMIVPEFDLEDLVREKLGDLGLDLDETKRESEREDRGGGDDTMD